jgi:hypothetical protein
LFLNFDQLSIDHDLVELRFHGREQLVQRIAEREVGAVPLKESSPDLMVSGPVKNSAAFRTECVDTSLSSVNLAVAAAAAADASANWTAAQKRCPHVVRSCPTSVLWFAEVRISPFILPLWGDLRQTPAHGPE